MSHQGKKRKVNEFLDDEDFDTTSETSGISCESDDTGDNDEEDPDTEEHDSDRDFIDDESISSKCSSANTSELDAPDEEEQVPRVRAAKKKAKDFIDLYLELAKYIP